MLKKITKSKKVKKCNAKMYNILNIRAWIEKRLNYLI